MRYIAGIDPGLSGAIAVLDFQTSTLHLWDTPVNIERVGDKNRKRPDVPGIVDALDTYPIDSASIEKVQSTPNDGHVGAFTFGKVTGIVIGALGGLDIPFTEITPAKWKMQMRVPADKTAARYRASQLFPHCSDAWSRVMDDGRAEAAIIALHHAIGNDLSPDKPFGLGLLNGVPYRPKKKKTKR